MQAQTMLAAMFYGPMDLRMEQRPIPQPGPDEVVLQVAAATTCGTDLKTYRRGHPLLFPRLPAGFGHEVAGRIAACGAGVTTLHEGEAVVVANSAPCLQCFYCRRGRFSLCEDLLLLNGAYAEYLLVPERIVRQNVHRLPAGTDFSAAALSEPLACALHGVAACEIRPGDTVAIIGAGSLGLLLCAAARLQGARVIIAGHGQEKLALASRFGAERVLDTSGLSTEEQCALLRRETEGERGADIVIEAVGTPQTWELAVRMVRRGGFVNLFGGCPGGSTVTLETRPLHYDELTLKGVFHHTPTYFAQALELISNQTIPVEALISERLPLADAVEALTRLLQKQGVKYALIPPAFQMDLEPR